MKNVKQNLVIVTICLLVAGFYSCMGEFSPRIEQFPNTTDYPYKDRKFVTVVWYHGEIVWSKYDKMDNINDSIVQKRYSEAVIITTSIKNSH